MFYFLLYDYFLFLFLLFAKIPTTDANANEKYPIAPTSPVSGFFDPSGNVTVPSGFITDPGGNLSTVPSGCV